MSFCIENSQQSEKPEKKKKKKSSKESPSRDVDRIKDETQDLVACSSPSFLAGSLPPFSSTPLNQTQQTKKDKKEKKEKKQPIDQKNKPQESSDKVKKRKHYSSSSSDDDSSDSATSKQDIFSKSPSKMKKNWKTNLRMKVPKTHKQRSHGEMLEMFPAGEKLVDDNTEVWMIQAPKNFNVSSVNGIKMDMSRPGSKKVTSDGNSYLVEWKPKMLPKSVVLPRSDSNEWRTVNQLSGSICIRQTVSMQQLEARPFLAYEPTFPTDLHQRFIPFGVTETVNSHKRKKKHKKHSPGYCSETSQLLHSSQSENDLGNGLII